MNSAILLHDTTSNNSPHYGHHQPSCSSEIYSQAVNKIKEFMPSYFSANYSELLNNVKLVKDCDRILVVSNNIFYSDILSQLNSPNVQVFCGQRIYKSEQLKILQNANVSVPKWLKYPSNYDYVFDTLGDKIVIKPDECFSAGRELVSIKKRGDKIDNINRWLYNEYVGVDCPPYWISRVTTLFGKIISGYMEFTDTPIGKWFPGHENYVGESAFIPDNIRQLGIKSSIEFTKYNCGIIANDIVGNGKNVYIVEINPVDPTMAYFLCDKPFNDFYDRPTLIAEACVAQLNV